MNAIEIQRSVELIAAEINHIKNETKLMVLNNSIEIGRRLVEAKAIIKHGEWGQWLETSVNYSQRTANNLMKIFTEYGSKQISLFGDSNSQAFANLSYSQAVALLSIPDIEERENFVKENEVVNMSTRELQQAIKDKEKAEAEMKKALKATKDIEIEKARLEADIRIKDQSLQLSKENMDKLQEEFKRVREANNIKINNLNNQISRINEQLEAAKESEDNDEVERLQEELNQKQNESLEYADKIRELEEKLKEKPIDVAVVEKIPDEVLSELEQLRSKANDDEAVIKYKVAFNLLVKSFNEVLESVKDMNDDMKNKYSGATRNLIAKMETRL